MTETPTHTPLPYECFRDASYYDMWCVRRVNEREWGKGFHLVNGDEAAALRDLLNTRADSHHRLVEALEEAREAIKHRGGPLCSSRYYSNAQCDCGAADAIAKIDAALKEARHG